VGHVELMGERRCLHRFLVGKHEGKKPHGRPRHRWKYNIEMGLQEVGYEGTDWKNVAQERDSWHALVNVVMNLRVP